MTKRKPRCGVGACSSYVFGRSTRKVWYCGRVLGHKGSHRICEGSQPTILPALCEHGILLDDRCAACAADAENDARYDAMKEGD